MAENNTITVSCHAPAKINLALHVTGQSSNGYHLLESLVVFAGHGDKITVSLDKITLAVGAEFQFSGPFADILSQSIGADKNHLIAKAALGFRESIFKFDHGLKIQCEKNLPIASGIGGGSADAAATLLALAKLNGGADFSDLLKIGECLGADLPMCLHSRPLIAKGIGGDIELVDQVPLLHLLLVNPGIEIATPQIFAALAQKDNSPLEPLPSMLNADNLIGWLARQRNDLEPVAINLAPQIGSVLEALNQCDARLSRMSGSGATCFGIFENEKACMMAAKKIKNAQPDWWIMQTETRNHGPDRAHILKP